MKQIEQTFTVVHSFDAVRFVFILLSRLSIHVQCLLLMPDFLLCLYLNDQKSSLQATIAVSEMIVRIS